MQVRPLDDETARDRERQSLKVLMSSSLELGSTINRTPHHPRCKMGSNCNDRIDVHFLKAAEIVQLSNLRPPSEKEAVAWIPSLGDYNTRVAAWVEARGDAADIIIPPKLSCILFLINRCGCLLRRLDARGDP